MLASSSNRRDNHTRSRNTLPPPASLVQEDPESATDMKLTLHRVPVDVLAKTERQKSIIKTKLDALSRSKDADASTNGDQHASTSDLLADLVVQLAQYLGSGRTGLQHASGTVKETGTDDSSSAAAVSPLESARANEKIGFLLSSKALVQLVANPLVGWWANRVGYSLPLLVGTSYLLVSSLGEFCHEKEI
jgi:hypothetical protein